MNLKNRIACPLCLSEHFILFREGNFTPGLSTPDAFKITDNHYGISWTLSRCKDCSFVFANPCPTQEDLALLYSKVEDPDYSSEQYGRTKNFKTILHRIHKYKTGNTLLDIGAASGIFLNLAQNEGFQVEGIEPSQSLSSQAKEKFNIDLHTISFEQFETKKRYSIITLLDIIEHVADPAGLIKKASMLLEENGLLVIVTPDIDSWAARIFKRKWWHFRPPHLHFFNLRTLELLLHSNHFEIISKKRYIWHFSLYYLFTQLLSSKQKNNKPENSLQNFLKRIHLKLMLCDSWEIYAKKSIKKQ